MLQFVQSADCLILRLDCRCGAEMWREKNEALVACNHISCLMWMIKGLLFCSSQHVMDNAVDITFTFDCLTILYDTNPTHVPRILAISCLAIEIAT